MGVRTLQAQMVPLSLLRQAEWNANRVPERTLVKIRRSIEEFGFVENLVARPHPDCDGTYEVLSGNHRLELLREMGIEEAPTVIIDVDEAQAMILAQTLNRTRGQKDDPASYAFMLETVLGSLGIEKALELLPETRWSIEQALYGASPRPKISMSDRFGMVPFTVLDMRTQLWAERKRQWIASGIRGDVGRDVDTYRNTEKIFTSNMEFATTSTSVFDPVLCELAYRWWCPEEAKILDPFAGGPVRGIVASQLGHKYVGIDLSERQVVANRDNLAEVGGGAHDPVWHVGDSRFVSELAGDEAPFDLIFSCPPYAYLERYSDDPADLSTLGYEDFIESFGEIIERSVNLLSEDSFIVLVMSEVRGKNGAYLGLVSDTTQIMRKLGCNLYSDAVLVTPTGTLHVRTSFQFPRSRKLGRNHQYMLVYLKGDWKKAAMKCAAFNQGEIDEVK